jgi:phosphoribosylanthranilate isomerase
MTVRIKICGITTPDDAIAAAYLGADAIGLNFYPRSPRYITETQAREILRVLPPFVEPIGLYVNESLEHVQHVALRLGLRTVQVHGEHTEMPPAGPMRFIPAFGIRDETGLARMKRYLERLQAAVAAPVSVLVDAHVPGMYGGTGQTAAWHLLHGLDLDAGLQVILAGGLTPNNIAEAIHTVNPYAVDVASGVESEPGRKDLELVRRFIQIARAAS